MKSIYCVISMGFLIVAFAGSDNVIAAPDENTPPFISEGPTGPDSVLGWATLDYSADAVDPDDDSVYFRWSWGDGDTTAWLGPYLSGGTCTASHVWSDSGFFDIAVLARDDLDEGEWSNPLSLFVYMNPCGDVDGSGFIDIDDVVRLIYWSFWPGNASIGPSPGTPTCYFDADGSGGVDIDDIVYLIYYIFQSGSPPVEDCCPF